MNIGSRLLKAIDSFMVQAASWTQRLLLWPLVIAMGAGISAWAWRHEAVLAKLADGFDALVCELPLRLGNRETRWMHLESVEGDPREVPPEEEEAPRAAVPRKISATGDWK